MSRITLGTLVKVVGLKGAFKLYTDTDPELFYPGLNLYLKDKAYEIEHLRFHKGMPVIKVKGLDDPNVVTSYLGSKVEAQREDLDLEEDTYFIDDLIGFDAYQKNEKVGTLVAIESRGVQDLYVFDIDGQQRLLPGVKEYIHEIDLKKGHIHITLIEDL